MSVITLNPQNKVSLNLKSIGILFFAIIVSNFFTYSFLGRQVIDSGSYYSNHSGLYLMNEASVFVNNTTEFEHKVREISNTLNIPTEWLMAVMYSESKFDASAQNFKGSGAAGLIQFMPQTAKSLGISNAKLRNMNHVEQLDYVQAYLQGIKNKYGDYKDLTALYLAILYPRALEGDYCYTLYAKPSVSYQQNAGLDENKDGVVTVKDIDSRMKRLFPTAYFTNKNS